MSGRGTLNRVPSRMQGMSLPAFHEHFRTVSLFMNFLLSGFSIPTARRWKRWGLPGLFCLAVLLVAASTVRADPGSSLTAHTAIHQGRFFVSGVWTSIRPGHQQPGSHVDIELIDARGQVIAAAADPIGRPTAHPRSTRWGRERFVVSFPETLGRETARVRVTFHNHPHSLCPGDC